MKKRLTFLAIFLCVMVGLTRGQQVDTLTYATGKITSAVTAEPVVARIFYQSLPYGSKIGTLNGSEFRFPLFDNDKYSITVEAAGFAPSKYMIDPADANEERVVIKNIELGLPNSAAEVAKSTHTPGKVMLLDNLIFQLGRAKISPESHAELDSVVSMLNDNPNMIIQLEGHTDYLGDPKENMKLSQERVDAVRDYLVSKGISKRKVKTKAFGGTMPLSTENTEVAHKLNRRVEVRILAN
jgi:outer membrane protein OmpA-like peptidoglycan-associated protein